MACGILGDCSEPYPTVTLQWVRSLSNSIPLSACEIMACLNLLKMAQWLHITSMTILHCIKLYISRLYHEVLSLALKNQTAMVWNVYDESHVAGNGRWSPGLEDSLHSTASQRLGPQSHSYKKMHSANSLSELRRGVSTNQVPNESVAWLTS